MPGSLPDSARVVIIGGGFAGASTAFWLARAGIDDVLIVERETTCGYHASGRNAAMGRQITENPRFTELAVAGARFLRRPPEGFAEGPLLSDCGSLLLAQRAATLERVAVEAARRDVAHRVVEPADVVRAWPVLRDTPMVGAVSFPGDGVIDIHALLLGFLAGARRGGARLVTSCDVRGFRPAAGGSASGVDVVCDRGTVRADVVVVAAGAWAGELGGRAGGRHRFDPVHRHLFVTGPVAGIDPGAPFAWHLDDEFYVRPEIGGLLVSGCDESVRPPADARPDSDAQLSLAAKLERMAPGLLDVGVARRWACLRTFTATAERGPLIGRDDDVPWLFWVAGLGGHGATGCAEVGRRAAALIAEAVSAI